VLIGVIGTLVGTLGGVLITQRRSDDREQAAWDREIQRERERWSREDEARTFGQRRDAYIGFYEALGQVLSRINHQFDPAPVEPVPFSPGWDYSMYSQLQRVEIYGSESLVQMAQRAFEVVTAWGGTLRPDPKEPGSVLHDGDLSYEAGGAPMMFIAALREELGVPKGARNKPD
jgi:hypothetical protein